MFEQSLLLSALKKATGLSDNEVILKEIIQFCYRSTKFVLLSRNILVNHQSQCLELNIFDHSATKISSISLPCDNKLFLKFNGETSFNYYAFYCAPNTIYIMCGVKNHPQYVSTSQAIWKTNIIIKNGMMTATKIQRIKENYDEDDGDFYKDVAFRVIPFKNTLICANQEFSLSMLKFDQYDSNISYWGTVSSDLPYVANKRRAMFDGKFDLKQARKIVSVINNGNTLQSYTSNDDAFYFTMKQPNHRLDMFMKDQGVMQFVHINSGKIINKIRIDKILNNFDEPSYIGISISTNNKELLFVIQEIWDTFVVCFDVINQKATKIIKLDILRSDKCWNTSFDLVRVVQIIPFPESRQHDIRWQISLRLDADSKTYAPVSVDPFSDDDMDGKRLCDDDDYDDDDYDDDDRDAYDGYYQCVNFMISFDYQIKNMTYSSRLGKQNRTECDVYQGLSLQSTYLY